MGQRVNQSSYRRFHRRPGDSWGRIRGWEASLWAALHKDPPEKKLAATVLAFSLWSVYRPLASMNKDDLISWLMHDEAEWPFSFKNLCDALDLEWEDIQRDVLRDAQVNVPVVEDDTEIEAC